MLNYDVTYCDGREERQVPITFLDFLLRKVKMGNKELIGTEAKDSEGNRLILVSGEWVERDK